MSTRCGIVTVSDSCCAGEQPALAGTKKYLIINERGTIHKVEYSESKVKVEKIPDRDRKSSYPMKSATKAQEIVIEETPLTLSEDEVPFQLSFGRILAANIFVTEPVPPFRASTKDGYAVKAADTAEQRLVVDVASAGNAPGKLSIKNGGVVRISAGAPIPEGANAVVQVEDTVLVKCTADNEKELEIQIKTVPQLGQNIREVGSDAKVGERVLKKYDRITAAHIGVLAMLGITKVRIMRAPLIGVISTGIELPFPWTKLKPGQIRESNKHTVLYFLRQYNYEPIDCGIAINSPNAIKTTLTKAFAANEFVISCGSVSMEESDIITKVLVEDFNARIHFDRVKIKSGTPITFATLEFIGRRKMFFGFPSDPESSYLTCILFVIPALRHFERSRIKFFPSVDTYCSERNLYDTPDYRGVIVKSDNQRQCLTSSSHGKQLNSKLNSMVGANGLTIVEHNYNSQEKRRKTILFDQLY